jgi:hypothetical protein
VKVISGMFGVSLVVFGRRLLVFAMIGFLDGVQSHVQLLWRRYGVVS